MRVVVITFLTALAIVSAQAEDRSWYNSAHIAYSDPYNLNATFKNGTWFRKYPDLHFIHVSQEVGYAELTKSDFDSLSTSQAQQATIESYDLSAGDARVVRGRLEADATNAVIPATADVLSSLINFVGPPGSFVMAKGAAGTFIKYLLSKDSTVRVDARMLGEVIADGGRLNHIMRVAKDDSHHAFLIEIIEYTVKVGNEERHYVPTSCAYAVKISYSEFRTDATRGNKIYRKIEGGKWQVIDIEDNKIEDSLLETSRDDDFLYLTENDPTNRSNEAYRISLNEGPLQLQQDGSWHTLCSKTHPVR